MKVKELIELLKRENPESEVILQKDAEGNSYSPLSDIDGNAVYVPVTSWHGEVYSLEWTADDACMSDEEWQEVNEKPRCVVLALIN